MIAQSQKILNKLAINRDSASQSAYKEIATGLSSGKNLIQHLKNANGQLLNSKNKSLGEIILDIKNCLDEKKEPVKSEKKDSEKSEKKSFLKSK